MQRLALVLVVVAVAVGVYFLVQDTDPGQREPDLPPGTGAGEDIDTDDPGGLKGTTPEEEIEPVALPLRDPAAVLVLGAHRSTWSAVLDQVLESTDGVSYRIWYLRDVAGTGEGDGGAAGLDGGGRGLPALVAPPTVAWLEEHDVRALLLDAADPNAFPRSFWNTVAERVRSGRMGLFVRPGFPSVGGDVASTAHPVLSHPVLAELIPVARASALQGQPVPGVFGEAQPIVPTDAGRRHPATRLVALPGASAKAWASAAAGDGAFVTRFCYPVQDLAEGAVTLLVVRAAVELPAVVVAPSDEGRVLWMGNVDFGQRAYFVREKDALMKMLVNHWVVWLVGQAEK